MRKRRYEMQKCNDNKNILIWDNETGECLGFVAQIKGRLNLQDDVIKDQQVIIDIQEQKITKLIEENQDLRIKLDTYLCGGDILHPQGD